MGATRNNSDGQKNYYNVSYGKLSTTEKTQPSNYTEIAEVELKSKTQNCESLDLRNRYVHKEGKERPFVVFYDELTGTLRAIERKENDNGITLVLEFLDTDLETSVVQTRFYSKYTENLLNRMLLTDLSCNFSMRPYSMPADFTTSDGKTKKYNNQGVSVNQNGQKIEGAFKNENGVSQQFNGMDLPPTEQVQGSDGKEQTSRVKRINFLFQLVLNKFNATEQQPQSEPLNTAPFPTTNELKEEEHDDLPF